MTLISKGISKLMYFGIEKQKYANLRTHKSRTAVKKMVDKLGADTINCGYTIRTYQHPERLAEFFPGRHMIIENAKYVSGIFGTEFYGNSGIWDDFTNCRKAEEDGVRLINDIPGLEKGRYVDTEENRKICKECLEADPGYRVENWLRTYSRFGRMYTDTYGDPTALRKYMGPRQSPSP